MHLQRVGSCYLEVSFDTTGVDAWCYLECYLVLPGRYLGYYLGVCFFCGPKISAFLKLKLLEKINFHLEMLPRPTPVVVTCLPGPPSESNVTSSVPVKPSWNMVDAAWFTFS